MTRKHFDLDNDIAKLVNKYQKLNDIEFNDLMNQALKLYLTKKMSYRDVQDALKEVDIETSRYIDETMRSSMGDINRNY